MSIYFIALPLCGEHSWGYGIRGYLMGHTGAPCWPLGEVGWRKHSKYF